MKYTIMKQVSRYIATALLLITSLSLGAQTLRTSYFLENSTLRHTLNPSFAPRQGYLGFPLISTIGLDIQSNMAVKNFFYPLNNGKMGTFLHPDVSADTFLSTLSPETFLSGRVNYDLFNLGFATGKSSFWSIDLGIRVNVNSNIPDEFFKFLKLGMTSDQTKYQIKDLSVVQNAYAQLSLGYSQALPFLEGLRVGGRVKFLVAVDNLQVNLDNLDLTLGTNEWIIASSATATLMGKGVEFEKDANGSVKSIKMNPSDLGIGGFGFGVDLGASYRLSLGTPVDGLTASLSVSDLGLISFPATAIRRANATSNTTYTGFQNVNISNLTIDQEIENLKNSLFAIVDFKEVSGISQSEVSKLNATLYAGLSYPFLKEKMNIGLLYTGRFLPFKTINELTLSYSYLPAKWFSATLSYSMINTYTSFGWLLNFTPKSGINFFIGSDYMPLRFSKQLIPIDPLFATFQAGLSIPIGKSKTKSSKKAEPTVEPIIIEPTTTQNGN